jgi:hypothetical protein
MSEGEQNENDHKNDEKKIPLYYSLPNNDSCYRYTMEKMVIAFENFVAGSTL